MSLTVEDIKSRLFYLCVNSLTLILIWVFNILVLRGLTTLEKTSNVNNWFYVNLAICDLLVGLTTGPATVTTMIFNKWLFGDTMCEIIAATDSILIITGTWTLAVSSIDRCIAVSKPFWHRAFITGAVVKQWIAMVWLCAIVVSILPFFNWGRYQFSSYSFNCGMGINEGSSSDRSFFLLVLVMSLLIPVSIIFVCYSLMLYVVLPSLISRQRMTHSSRKEKSADSSSGPKSTAIEVIEEQMTVRVQVTNMGTVMSSGGSSVDIIVTDDNNSNDPRLCRMSSVSKMCRKRMSTCSRLQSKKRSTLSVTLRPAFRTLVIVGVFFVCTGPTFITALIFWINPGSVAVPTVVSRVMHWMVFLNSALNPLVYGLMDQDIRQLYFRVLCCRSSNPS